MSNPKVSKTDPFCDNCLNDFNQTINKIKQINTLLNSITTDINARKEHCGKCCRGSAMSTNCVAYTRANDKSAGTVRKMKRSLVELYREVKRYYLPDVTTSKLG